MTTSVDVGHLLLSDTRLLDLKEYKSNLKEYLKQICTEDVQQIVNEVYSLPVETVNDVLCAKLPKPTTLVPREKPLPKTKPLTKWQEYAKLKGIKNVKKTKMVYDEATKEYKPRYGYKRANDETKAWLVEVPDNAENPNEDFFAKRVEAKSERTAKNELQRLRNIARSTNGKVRGIPLIPKDRPERLDLVKSLNAAKTSDASMSKFSEKVENEDTKTKGMAKKRKFEPNSGSVETEKEKQLKIFSKIVSTKDKSSKEKLDMEKAVNQQISKEDQEKRDSKKKKAGGSKKKQSGGGFKRGGGSRGGSSRGGFSRGGGSRGGSSRGGRGGSSREGSSRGGFSKRGSSRGGMSSRGGSSRGGSSDGARSFARGGRGGSKRGGFKK